MPDTLLDTRPTDVVESDTDRRLRQGAERARQTREAREAGAGESDTAFASMLGRIAGTRASFDRVAELEARSSYLHAQAEADRREAAVRNLAVPLLYADATLDSLDAHAPELVEIRERAGRFIAAWPERQVPSAAFPQIVLMLGVPGSGKGHVVWSIARAIAREYGDSAIVGTLGDIVKDIRAAWRADSSEDESQKLRRYRRADLLVIDEVSRHALYGEPAQHLYDLIAHREQWLRPTIVTSNDSLEELGQLIGPALVSRAMGWSDSWRFPATDYRVRRREARAGLR